MRILSGSGTNFRYRSRQNNFVFVLNQGDADNLVAYQFDAVSGTLTMDSKTWGPYSSWAFTGGAPADSSGSFVYTLGFAGQPQVPYRMTGYMIDQSNGSLTPVPNAPYPTWQNNYANGLVVTQ